jgi:hypothetical protein
VLFALFDNFLFDGACTFFLAAGFANLGYGFTFALFFATLIANFGGSFTFARVGAAFFADDYFFGILYVFRRLGAADNESEGREQHQSD